MAIITIGGNLGAGKTTLAGNLAAKLGYETFSMGGIFREMAAQRNMSIEQFYAQLKNDRALEESVDERQKKLMREKDNLVVQGRVAWFFAQGSPFKITNILLTVDPLIGAKRVAERKENAGIAVEEVARANTARAQEERERYKLLYDIENYLDPTHYNIILDTSHIDSDEVLKKVFQKISDRF